MIVVILLLAFVSTELEASLQGLFSGARTRDSRAVFRILALKSLGRERFSHRFQNSRAEILRARDFLFDFRQLHTEHTS